MLDISVDKEACPLNLAPTTSTLTTLVLGDALAVSLMNLKNFRQEDFALTHPGGSLGRRLLLKVKDEMITNNLPFVDVSSKMQDVIVKMTECRLGLALVGSSKKLVGIITDGDLRRNMNDKLFNLKASNLMTKKPAIGNEDMLIGEALNMMNNKKITSLFICEKNKPIGIIHIHDLLRLSS